MIHCSLHRSQHLLVTLALIFVGCAEREEQDSASESMVVVTDVHPGILLDIRYATKNNFTGQVLYESDICLLRRSVAERLGRVQRRLEKEGLGLLVFDGYRPLSVQKRLWEVCPDPRYVADPARGSRHNRGAAVDLTLVNSAGQPLEMPTDYDDFSEAAHRDYEGCSEMASANRARLAKVMSAEGFVGLPTEWWHFDAVDWERFPIE